MALDGIFLYSILDEINNKILNGKVDKINQPEKDEIILTIRGSKANFKLLISASSVYPKMHFTNTSKPNPQKAPMFCMVLRKYLGGARIVNVRQLTTDRIAIIDFESMDELGFNSIYSLFVEIMGRHSNITLVRQRDKQVIDSIKHITPDINSYRSLYPGIKYVLPPESTRLNPFDFSKEDFKNYITSQHIKYDENMFSKIFTGISTQFSKEIFFRISSKNIAIENDSINEIFSALDEIFSSLLNKDFYFASYFDKNIVKDFYCTKLTRLDNLSIKTFDSPSTLVEDYYSDKDKSDRLTSKSADLQKIVSTNLDRCFKKYDILEKTISESAEKEKYKINGDLLAAAIYSIKKGDKSANVLNYYSENEEYIDIPLDENKTPSENIQSYYKKYNKLKKTEEMALIQIKSAEEEMQYLQSVHTNIKNAETYEEIEEIRKELLSTGYIRFKKSENKKSKDSKPLHFVSSDGLDIYVGKNNLQNDYLTLKFSDKHDLWLHTKDIPGSHVIIKGGRDIPDSTLEEAAIMAAYYSKSKDSSKVAVDYTEVKNVKKPSGAKPGMVIYYTNKTIYVTPEKLNLKKI